MDLTLSSDKKWLTTTDEAGLVKVWDLANRKEVQTLTAFTARTSGWRRCDESGRYAAGDGGPGQPGAAVGRGSGKELRQWDFGGSRVRTLAFTPDGKQIVTGNANTTLYLLELP